MSNATVSIKVVRKYSFRRILGDKQKYEVWRLKAELASAWGMSQAGLRKLFEVAADDEYYTLNVDQLMSAARILDVNPDEIIKEFPEPEDFRL